MRWDCSGFHLREWKLAPAQETIVTSGTDKQDSTASVRPETIMRVFNVAGKANDFHRWLMSKPEDFNKLPSRMKLRIRNSVIREDKVQAAISMTGEESQPPPPEIVYLVKDARARKKNRKTRQ